MINCQVAVKDEENQYHKYDYQMPNRSSKRERILCGMGVAFEHGWTNQEINLEFYYQNEDGLWFFFHEELY